MKMDAAAPADRVAASHEQYLTDWSTNATHFDKEKLYDWMATKLKDAPPKQVLDIGCGTGEGLIALLRAYDCKILAIEENKAVIRAAQQRVEREGYNVELCERLRHLALGPRQHQLGIQTGKLSANSQVSLVEGDWLSQDEELFRYLEDLPKFDAVTMWLTGAHRVRTESANIAVLRLRAESQYRLHMQNKAYEVAERILRPGGLLHIVDRGNIANPELLRTVMLDAHREQASVTSLDVFDADSTPYTESEADARVRMVATKGTTRSIATEATVGMISVLARKP